MEMEKQAFAVRWMKMERLVEHPLAVCALPPRTRGNCGS